MLCLDIKQCHQLLEGILSVEAGVEQIAFFCFPFGESSVVIHLLGVLDDKWHNAIAQAFLECYQTANSAVTVLKRIGIVNISWHI